MIPEWKAVNPQHRIVRLSAVANQAETDVTVRNILYLQSLATGTTSIYPLAYAIRMKKVRIWFCAPTLASNISSTVEWNAGTTGFLMDGVSVAATSSSTTEYSCLVTRPPTDSLASWYQMGVNTDTNVLFSFSAPAGAIIEVSYDWVPNFTEIAGGSRTVAGAVLGTLYAWAWNANVLPLPPLNSVV